MLRGSYAGLKRQNDKASSGYKRKNRYKKTKSISSISRFQASSVSPELKSYDFAMARQLLSSTTTPGMQFINGITAGTTSSTMLGRNCTLKSVTLNYSVITEPRDRTAGLGSDVPVNMRVILFYDKEPGGVMPTYSDLLTNNTTEAFYNLTNAGRFIVLHDETHSMGISAYANIGVLFPNGIVQAQGENCVTRSKHCKISLPMKGPSAAGAIGGVTYGGLFVLAYSDRTNATTNNYVSFTTRVRYTDA